MPKGNYLKELVITKTVFSSLFVLDLYLFQCIMDDVFIKQNRIMCWSLNVELLLYRCINHEI